MDYSSVNNISIEKVFWAQFREYLINFKFYGLPHGVHLTFSFNENSDYLNFHVSRNVSVPDGILKPQIEIFRIKKELLKELAKPLYLQFLNSYLEPFDVTSLSKKVKFISFDSIENSKIYPIIEQKIIDVFTETATLKGTSRLKIKDNLVNISSKLSELNKSEKVIDYLNENLIKIPKLTSNEIRTGIIVSGKTTVFLLGIYGKWYKIRETYSLSDLLDRILGRSLAKDLLLYTKKSIIRVKNAESKVEIQKYQKHIELTMRKN
jgi:hypothetical protein